MKCDLRVKMRKKYFFLLLICFLLLSSFLVSGEIFAVTSNCTGINKSNCFYEVKPHQGITIGENLEGETLSIVVVRDTFWLSLFYGIFIGIIISIWSITLTQVLNDISISKPKRVKIKPWVKIVLLVLITIFLYLIANCFLSKSFVTTIVRIPI